MCEHLITNTVDDFKNKIKSYAGFIKKRERENK